MKTNSLFSHVKIVLEAEDDLFPGLDSSALVGKKEEDNTKEVKALIDKQSRIREFEAGLDSTISRLLDHFQANGAWEWLSNGPKRNQIIPYSEFDWFDKYENAKMYIDEAGILKSSPLLKGIEKNIRVLDGYNKRMVQAKKDLKRVMLDLEAVESAAREQDEFWTSKERQHENT